MVVVEEDIRMNDVEKLRRRLGCENAEGIGFVEKAILVVRWNWVAILLGAK